MTAARRGLSAAALLVAPLLGLAGGVLHPERKGGADELLRVVTANLDRWYAAHLLFFLGALLLLPAAAVLAELAWSRARGLALAGAAVTAVGLVGAAGVAALELAVWALAQPSVDPAEAAPVVERLTESAAVAGPVYGASVGFPVGFAILAAALWRAAAAPRWNAALVGTGPLLFSVGGLGGSRPLTVLGGALAAAGLGAIGLRLLATRTAALPAG